MTFPTELPIECPMCGALNELLLTTMRGVYQGYCENDECGEWIEFDYDEALASEEAERAMDARRDERYEE